MENPIEVYVVADYEPLRTGLVKSIAAAPDLEAVGEASSLEEMAREGAQRFADVLVIDMEAVNATNRDAMYQRLTEWVPAMKVLFLGTPHDAADISFESLVQAIDMHTIGFLFKSGSSARTINAIRLSASGAFVCETDVIKRILTQLSRWASYSPDDTSPDLSPRETEVLKLVAQGRANKEIARDLFLSEGTVKAHISHIMTKLSVDRRTELVRYALGKGLVSLVEE